MMILKIFKTPIHIQPAIFLLIPVLWIGATCLNRYWHPNQNFWLSILLGFITMLLLILADFGHSIAHISSARYSGYPMDEIRLTVTQMPHTLYNNNLVPPNVHRMRALGGPLFNAIWLFLSLAVRFVSSANSIATELATWSASAHSMMLLMSLAPSPILILLTVLKKLYQRRFCWYCNLISRLY